MKDRSKLRGWDAILDENWISMEDHTQLLMCHDLTAASGGLAMPVQNQKHQPNVNNVLLSTQVRVFNKLIDK